MARQCLVRILLALVLFQSRRHPNRMLFERPYSSSHAQESLASMGKSIEILHQISVNPHAAFLVPERQKLNQYDGALQHITSRLMIQTLYNLDETPYFMLGT